MTGSHVSIYNTQSSTAVAVITGSRIRSASLSLTLSLAVPPENRRTTFQTLPTEIAVRIIELASAPVASTKQKRTTGYRLYTDGYINSDTEDDDQNEYEENEFYRVRHDVKTLLAIAQTCHSLSQLAHIVLYRNVRVSDPRRAELFARTVTSTAHALALQATQTFLPATMLGKSVSRLVLECVPSPGAVGMGHDAYVRREQGRRAKLSAALILNPSALYGRGGVPISAKNVVSPVLAALKTLVIHTDTLMPVLECMDSDIVAVADESASLGSTIAPTEIIFDTFLPPTPSKTAHSFQSHSPHFAPSHSSANPQTRTPSSILPSLSRNTTHLRILNPPPTWRNPADTISALMSDSDDENAGTLGKLTHLAVPRRANANEENDIEFVEWVRSVLSAPSNLECVVVSVFPPTSSTSMSTSLSELNDILTPTFIWSLLSDVARSDSRLCVVPGRKGAWNRACVGDRFERQMDDGNHGGYSGVKNEKVDYWTWAREFEMQRSSEMDV